MSPVIITPTVHVSVLRPAGQQDSTLGGVTATHDRLAVVGYTVRDRAAQLRHGTATEVHAIPDARSQTITAAEPAVILVVIEDLFGNRTARLVPAVWDTERSKWSEEPHWWMAGGNYATTSDSRIVDLVSTLLDARFYGALAVHDRNEHQAS